MAGEKLIGKYTGLLNIDGNPLTDSNGRLLRRISGKFIRVGDGLFVDISSIPDHQALAKAMSIEEKLKDILQKGQTTLVEGGSFNLVNVPQPNYKGVVDLHNPSSWLQGLGYEEPSDATKALTEGVWQRLNPGFLIRRQ